MRESGEDYIETIYLLKKRRGFVRSADVARELNFSRPSVSRAVGILEKDGYVTISAEDGGIDLTPKGEETAIAVFEKHETLTRFLMGVAGVDPDTAENDACKIEHIVSPATFAGIKDFMKGHPELLAGVSEPEVYHTHEVRR